MSASKTRPTCRTTLPHGMRKPRPLWEVPPLFVRVVSSGRLNRALGRGRRGRSRSRGLSGSRPGALGSAECAWRIRGLSSGGSVYTYSLQLQLIGLRSVLSEGRFTGVRSLGAGYTGSSSYKVTALLSVRSEYYGGDDGGSVGSEGWGVRGVMRTREGPRTWSWR